MKFNTPTTRRVKSTQKRKLVGIYVEKDGLEDSLVHYINPLIANDAIWHRLTFNLAACYQLAQSILKIGFALAKKAR